MTTGKHRITALYCRLSRDDDYNGDSASIQTQKQMLEQYAKQNSFSHTKFYIDDGYSGTSFERPGFQELINDIEKGKVSTIITKDLSRLGRDYLKTGYYLENYFPEQRVRFIAVNDSVDSSKEHQEFTPFRNIMNEWYAKDISKKIRSAYHTKALEGKFTGPFAPYGYMKNPNNKHQLIIHPETGPVVQRIFELARSGLTTFKISMVLSKDKILKPRAQIIKDHGKYVMDKFVKHPFDWSSRSIHAILGNMEYLGHLVCNRNKSKSFKDRTLINVPKADWIIVKNTHEALIDEEIFNIIQPMITAKRTNIKETTTYQMFVGLLRCPDCGKTLSFSRYNNRKSFGAYACSTYRRFGKGYCTTHYISYEKLYHMILDDINKHLKHAKINEETVLKHMLASNQVKHEKDLNRYQKEILKFEKRVEDINTLIKKIYEDRMHEKISEERFIIFLKDYETEQTNIKENIEALRLQLSDYKDKKDDTEKFLSIIRKYKH
ncbi:MAG: recombinase family protein, partial [Crenarchaeota archaeon]|nr:recombinase family protein [Thermoproteota archaeon]